VTVPSAAPWPGRREPGTVAARPHFDSMTRRHESSAASDNGRP
jgi:hypothetical protein